MSAADVYVHVGPHKSGTTFIQQVLTLNRDRLASHDVLFPGKRYADQRAAVLELLRTSRGRRPDKRDRPQWGRLVAELDSWSGSAVIISMETLDGASESTMRDLVGSLEPARVHIVYTARDLTRVVPGMWQTRNRNRHTESWNEYISRLRETEDSSRWPWKLAGQDPRHVLGRWERHVPRDRIHVVTVPPEGGASGLLWERFCSVVGLEPLEYSLDVDRANRSLGNAEAEFLRTLNIRLATRMSRTSYVRWVQRRIAQQMLEERGRQAPLELPAEDFPWVCEHAERFVGYLRTAGYDVIGDLDELIPARPVGGAGQPDSVEEAELLEVAFDVLAGLLVHLDAEEQEMPRWERKLQGAGRRLRLLTRKSSRERSRRP